MKSFGFHIPRWLLVNVPFLCSAHVTYAQGSLEVSRFEAPLTVAAFVQSSPKVGESIKVVNKAIAVKPRVVELSKLAAATKNGADITTLYQTTLVLRKKNSRPVVPPASPDPLAEDRIVATHPIPATLARASEIPPSRDALAEEVAIPQEPMAQIAAAFPSPNLVLNDQVTDIVTNEAAVINAASLAEVMAPTQARMNTAPAVPPQNSINMRRGAENSEESAVPASDVATSSNSRVTVRQENFKSATLTLQVLDEKSVPEKNILYPIADARIRIIGSEFIGRTNLQGVIAIGDVPLGSRILVVIDDPQGRLVPTLTEVSHAEEDGGETQVIQVMSYRFYDFNAQVFQVTQRADMGSFCGQVPVARLRERGIDIRRISLNREAEGPFYFDEVGPSPNRTELGDNGRFCFYNVTPGLVEVLFSSTDADLTALTVPVFAGHHLDEVFSLFDAHQKQLHLAGLPTAYEQLFGDRGMNQEFRPVPRVDLVAVGENQQLETLDFGLMGIDGAKSLYRDRMYTLTQSPEFESTLYAVDGHDAHAVVPLIQRGFIESLYQELNTQDGRASQAFDPAMGSIVMSYYKPKDLADVKVNFKLRNAQNQEVGEGWYYGTGDEQNRAVFFNLEPGVYAVIVEDERHNWLDATTIAVDRWTVSLAILGNKLQAR